MHKLQVVEDSCAWTTAYSCSAEQVDCQFNSNRCSKQ